MHFLMKSDLGVVGTHFLDQVLFEGNIFTINREALFFQCFSNLNGIYRTEDLPLGAGFCTDGERYCLHGGRPFPVLPA